MAHLEANRTHSRPNRAPAKSFRERIECKCDTTNPIRAGAKLLCVRLEIERSRPAPRARKKVREATRRIRFATAIQTHETVSPECRTTRRSHATTFRSHAIIPISFATIFLRAQQLGVRSAEAFLRSGLEHE
jgi:hypothetical protein